MMILFICSRKETPWMDCICWLHEDVSLYMTLVEKTEVNFHRKAHCEGPSVTEPPHATMTEHPSEPHVTTGRTTIPPYSDAFSTTPQSTHEPHTDPQPSTGHPRTTVPPYTAPSTRHPSTGHPRTTVPPYTAPSTGHPRTTVPPYTAPSTRHPPTTVPPYTAPSTGHPRTTVPPYTAPRTGHPHTTVPPYTAPSTGHPRTTVPPYTAPSTGHPRTTVPPYTAPSTRHPYTEHPRTTVPPYTAPSTRHPYTEHPHTPVIEPDFELIMRIGIFIDEIFKTLDCLFPSYGESPIANFLMSITMPTDYTHYHTLALVDTIMQKLVFTEHEDFDHFMEEIYSSGIDQVNTGNCTADWVLPLCV